MAVVAEGCERPRLSRSDETRWKKSARVAVTPSYRNRCNELAAQPARLQDAQPTVCPAFADLFTDRQLVALTTFSDLVAEAREKVLADALMTAMDADAPRLCRRRHLAPKLMPTPWRRIWGWRVDTSRLITGVAFCHVGHSSRAAHTKYLRPSGDSDGVGLRGEPIHSSQSSGQLGRYGGLHQLDMEACVRELGRHPDGGTAGDGDTARCRWRHVGWLTAPQSRDRPTLLR